MKKKPASAINRGKEASLSNFSRLRGQILLYLPMKKKPASANSEGLGEVHLEERRRKTDC